METVNYDLFGMDFVHQKSLLCPVGALVGSV